VSLQSFDDCLSPTVVSATLVHSRHECLSIAGQNAKWDVGDEIPGGRVGAWLQLREVRAHMRSGERSVSWRRAAPLAGARRFPVSV